ncbi:hypothetical protein N5U14_09855 [Aliarcobacter butzleri]|uniref:hypothetical protein n=1 Tax=Aliarcobacter butzleri TaxID=28197 RepID=UPI0021B38900|nr:hypothetical protein [Aliarcobacter butzleri]MCT7611152.1 hypothetical protein [Aliarcobacter butzleri]
MKIKEYIQYRYNLESIDINDLEKIDYKKENNDYKTLISVAQTYSTERDYFNITYIFFIIGIIFALFFSLGYIDNKSKEINILEYILFVIAIPFTFMLTISIMKIYSKLKKKKIDFINLLEMPFFIEKFKKFYIEKEALRILSPFYWNIVTITYSITSILLLLKYTAVNKYNFYWSSTWISKEIIFLFSKPVELLSLNIIPKELKQENIYSFVSSNPMWLWFLIVLTLIFTLFPKILFLIFNKINSENKLKESFISSNKYKIILDKISPNTSTTNNYEITDIRDDKKNNIQKIRFNLSQNDSVDYKTVIFWQLTKTAIEKVEETPIYSAINKIFLHYVKELNENNIDKNESILVLVNVENSPQYTFINLLNKLNNKDITVRFVDSDGRFINLNDNINEWERYVKEKNIEVGIFND